MSMSLVEWVCRSMLLGLRKTSYRLALLLLGCGVLIPGFLSAQGSHAVKSGASLAQSDVYPSGKRKQGRSVVTLNVVDSSASYVIREIVRQTGIKVIYDKSNEALAKKIRVNVKDKSPLEVLQNSLAGIGLSVKLAPDGETVMIGSSEKIPVTQGQDVKAGSISGTVIDSATKKWINGVTIVLAGKKFSATTRDDGKFIISNVPNGNYQLSAKMLGYSQKSVSVVVNGAVANINIQLIATATSLNEVVTTATGPQRRVEVPHDVATINPSEIMARSPVRSVADILEAAQVPGVQVQRGGGDPGAATKVRIRGISSISQTNDPVVIVDGVWIDATTSSPSKLDDIDPATVEKIEIVRGPSAATLYGQDASNGVIVITTKKGRPGTTRWNLTYNRDWGQTYGRLPLTYLGMGHGAQDRAPVFCNIANMVGGGCVQDSVLIFDPNSPLLAREGSEVNSKYLLGMDGGSNTITYAITATSMNTIGVRKTSDADLVRFRKVGYEVSPEFKKPSELNRRNFTTRLDINPRSNISLGITLTSAQSQLRDNRFDIDWGFNVGGVVANTSIKSFNADTNIRSDYEHKVLSVENPKSTNTGIISGVIKYHPRSNIVINGTLGVENITTESSEYKRNTNCHIVTGCIDALGARAEQATNRVTYTARANTSLSIINLGKLNRFLEIRPSIGGDLKRTKLSDISIGKIDIPAGDRSLSSGVLWALGTGHELYENATAGWYLNSNIGIAKRIYFDVGIRQDIGSAITTSSRYPKIGGSWLISDEPFWKTNNLINLLRLRTAIGHSAVQPDIGDIYGKFVSTTVYLDGKTLRSARIDGIGNSKLKSERAIELELGFDADIIYDRINLILTYATSQNKNALINRHEPPSFGSGLNALRKENVAKVSNKNFELSVKSRLIETRTTFVHLDYTLTLTENRVERLGGGVTPGDIYEGYPIAGVWTRTILGYDDRDQDGLLRGNEVLVSDEKIYLGWSQPRYRSGYGISVTLLNQITFDSRLAYQSQYVKSVNNSALQYGSQDANAPLPAQAQEIIRGLNPSKPVSDLRWNSASIRYQVPGSIANRINARSLSISLQGRNLGLWTNYIGRDPSINDHILINEGSFDGGGSPPPPRLYVIDFKVGF